MNSLTWHSLLHSTPMSPFQTFNLLSLTRFVWGLPVLLFSLCPVTLTYLRFNEMWDEGHEDRKAWNI